MRRKKRIRPIHEYLVILITIIVIICEIFYARPTIVDGISMRPTFENNDIVLMNTLAKEFERGDFIIFHYSLYMDNELDEGRAIKRVIGLEGDHVLLNDKGIFVNGIQMFSDIPHDSSFKESIVPQDHYFVLGDNRILSVDSRMMGPIHKDDVIGKGYFILNKLKKPI